MEGEGRGWKELKEGDGRAEWNGRGGRERQGSIE